MCCIPHKSTVCWILFTSHAVSLSWTAGHLFLQILYKYKYYLSSSCQLVSTWCSCTFSSQRVADFGSWGGWRGFKIDGKPSKESTYLSPTNIPMMTNYPSYTATWHTSTTSGNQYRCVGGRGSGGLLLCCGAAWVFRSQCSHYSPLCLKQRRVSQEPDAIQREVYYPG